ncbi:decorin-binding protein DbpA [Borreliella tanukii]|uniref:decorin-binding protein DbpA n=1 Tax=Borreliella tanukii TaxID=56146 RepID=UPI0026486405|nr:decorin-binding protein DbpA [Borreliella tanukii]WKC80308.1 decorin-binding protein DbpA [Borreliella tanukii]
MNKYNKNLIKLTLIASLFAACGLTGETKIKLESSVQDVKDEITRIKKEAASKGVNFDAFTDKKTGTQVAGPLIKEAKLRAIKVSEKFLTAIEEEANKLKESGSSSEFSAMYDLIFNVAKALKEIGIQEAINAITKDIEERPATTAERILEIKDSLWKRLQCAKYKNTTPQNQQKQKEMSFCQV